MSDHVDLMAVYLHLALASGRRQRPIVRNRFLVLAAASAQRAALDRVADYCRRRVLEQNPAHLLHRWTSMAAAMTDPEFHTFLLQQERKYPREHAESLLQQLQIERGRERETYYDDEEYAAALLSVTVEELEQ